MTAVEIRPLGGVQNGADAVERLAQILIATVAAGGSVTYLHPLPHETAVAYWREALADTARRVVLGAFLDGALVGTVTLWLGTPQNQPFRAEIWKLMTDPAVRRRGVARALMHEAERLAAEHGRSLLTLDTVADQAGARLYESLGWVKVGEIPRYAYEPHGRLAAAAFYYKPIEPHRAPCAEARLDRQPVT